VIEDTWSVSGLCGTGSHHFHVDGTVVPAERTYAPMNGEPCLDAPIVHLPPPAVFSLVMASVALGIAQGALDDITVLASDKVPLLSAVALGGNPLFQFELATADTDVRAARGLLYEEAERLWSAAATGDPLTMEHRAQVRASAVWTVERATSVVTAAYRAGGGTSLYTDCPLQRRLRDIHALAQHFIVRRDTLVTAGAILAGQDVQPMVF
jgi:alkylation response protein AidB-like acyl-CoA dehydrogenase